MKPVHEDHLPRKTGFCLRLTWAVFSCDVSLRIVHSRKKSIQFLISSVKISEPRVCLEEYQRLVLRIITGILT